MSPGSVHHDICELRDNNARIMSEGPQAISEDDAGKSLSPAVPGSDATSKCYTNMHWDLAAVVSRKYFDVITVSFRSRMTAEIGS